MDNILSLLVLPLLIFLSPHSSATADDAALYFSKVTLFSDYHKMLTTFKIFIYPPPPPYEAFQPPFNFTTTPPLSLFYASLFNSSHFLTRHPEEADLFLLPFPPQSTRSLVRLIQRIRTSYPFWDRSLGADHFYLSRRGVGPSSSRNVVELKKNAVQISCFPLPAGEFIPHKDVTLPPPTTTNIPPLAIDSASSTRLRLGYWQLRSNNQVLLGLDLLSSLIDDPGFLIESEPSDHGAYIERLQNSKFCLFAYEERELELLGAALAHGCVPVVITDRPIQELPLMDVIRWSEIALFVGERVGHEELKRAMIRTCESGGYERMQRLGVAASQHLRWNKTPEPYDAFNMVMYQLWRSRHAIRYARWGVE